MVFMKEKKINNKNEMKKIYNTLKNEGEKKYIKIIWFTLQWDALKTAL